MPLCNKKGKEQTQKVIIPRGMINSGETTIIEIPAKLHREPVVVAKRKPPNNDDSLRYAPMPSSSKKGLSPQRAVCGTECDNLPYNYSARDQQQLSLPPPPPPPPAPPSLLRRIVQPSNHSNRSINIASTPSRNMDLDETEYRERMELQRDLEEFQRARRKLLNSASQMTSKSYLNESSYFNTSNSR